MSGHSILEGRNLPPIVVPEDKTSQYTILAVFIIVILTFLIWATHTMASTISSTELYGQCAVSQCPTNIYNGEKRCSKDPNEVMLYDPKSETCNSRYTCENPRTPYALQSDGSTDRNGVCETGSVCRCLTKQQCPSYSMVLFKMQNGSAYLNGTRGDRYTIGQKVVNSPSGIGVESVNYDNGNTEFCRINAYDTNRLAPGACNFTSMPTPDNMLDCTNSNPCITGALSYVTNQDSSKFVAQRDINYYPLACVPGVPCSKGLYPVWDPKVGQIGCVYGK
jgi:hypothetical protein